MKFKSLKTEPPKDGTWCLFRRKDGYVNTQPQAFFADEKKAHYVDYAVLPSHFVDNPEGWLSPYRGDPLPRKDSSCLVCTDNRKRMPFYAYFLAKEERFLGGCDADVIAYQYI